MRLERSLRLMAETGVPAVLFQGECRIGHKRRCPKVVLEPAVSLGEGCCVEAALVGMGTFVGQGTTMKRVEEVGRFVTIGEQCRIGVQNPGQSSVLSLSLPVRDGGRFWNNTYLPVKYPVKLLPAGRVRIGNDVWIGDGVVIGEEVSVGDGALLRPGSVVMEEVPPYGIVSGNPGSLEGFRFSEEEIRRLLKIRWWDYGTKLMEEMNLMEGSTDQLLEAMEGKLMRWKEENQEKEIPKGQEGILFCQEGSLCSIYSLEQGRQTLLHRFPEGSVSWQ